MILSCDFPFYSHLLPSLRFPYFFSILSFSSDSFKSLVDAIRRVCAIFLSRVGFFFPFVDWFYPFKTYLFGKVFTFSSYLVPSYSFGAFCFYAASSPFELLPVFSSFLVVVIIFIVFAYSLSKNA